MAQDRVGALIPPPEEVRKRLAETVREVDLLRGLLKLSEKAAEQARRARSGIEIGNGLHAREAAR